MRSRSPLALALVLLAAAACGAQSPAGPKPASLGTPFVLKTDESALVDGLQITFEAVKDDSRCPTGVQCVWAGDATVRVVLGKPPAAPATRELHVVESGRAADYSGYRVSLESLAPAPRADAAVPPKAYRVTLKVTTAPGAP